MACAVKTASLNCAARKGSLRAFNYVWSKEFMEAGKRRLAGDTARAGVVGLSAALNLLHTGCRHFIIICLSGSQAY